jgi:hypothetical protein
VLSFVGVHLMHPPGAPEHMTDAAVAAWIAPAAKQISAGGSLGILACLLLLVFAQGWSARLGAWGTPAWAGRLAVASMSITAAALGVGALLQVTAGLSALPSENTTEPSLAATLVNLYGALAVSGLGPARARGARGTDGFPAGTAMGLGCLLRLEHHPGAKRRASAGVLGVRWRLADRHITRVSVDEGSN